MNAGNAPRHGGQGNGLESLNDADVADLWVMDPNTGSYRLRTPEGQVPAPGAAPEDDAFAGLYRDSDSSGRADRRRAAAATATEAPPEAPPSRTTRRTAPPPKSKLKKRLKWTALGLVLTLVIVAGAAYGYYLYLNSRIKKTARSGNNEVPAAAADDQGRTPLNVLLIGSDSRLGKGNQGYGDDDHPGLADTTILMHISADRSNATMVSIPRDTMVERPKCTVNGKTAEASNGPFPFNETLGDRYGGAPCTVATVERMLGVRIDHYLMIDFNGVKEMTKAVDGVPIVLCDPINDPVRPNHGGGTGLVLTAGPHTLEGNDALQFLRARHAFGDGSDLARIEAQKSFLMALAREIKSNAKWSNPKALFDIAQAATGNLQVDEGLGTIDKLVSLGNQIKKVPENRMAFTTLPNEPYPPNPEQRVQPAQPDARNLWAALAKDQPVTKGDPTAPADPNAAPQTAAPAPPPPAPVDPATMKVSVRNTTKAKKATSVVEQLNALKYKASVDTTNDGRVRDNSVIRYPKGQLDAAKQLATAVGLPDTAIEESTLKTTTFELVIGSDFPNLNSPTAKIPGATANTSTAPASGAPVTVPPAEDLKLNTADNTKCISTGKSKK
ncbi:LCP family protein [Yinghuangia seranimata]|uniref:LCP family protein n=1 Tax=Yinghuangia seranimata TaxID=408067 RepID=UPI00248CEA61|nr:LCP family protein [Yinghuangia seranimata]MDI2132252.1 LCP family protein [Yinghuangia seranimata]